MKSLISKILFLSIILITNSYATVYENGDTGTAEKWNIYDVDPAGATITNVYDEDKQSNVILFNGTGTQNGYKITGSSWNNTNEKFIKWSMKYNENYSIFIAVSTTKGHRYLYYTQNNTDSGLLGTSYIHHGLGGESKNGTWQTISRDLNADIKEYESDNELISVNAFFIKGSGKIDDIELLENLSIPSIPLPEYIIYEDAETDTTDKWVVSNGDVNTVTISNLYDEDRQSNVIVFDGNGTRNGYKIAGNSWKNKDYKKIRWSMKYNENYLVFIAATTSKGHRYLDYSSKNEDSGLIGTSYIHHGLGEDTKNGTWQTITRDIEADLKEYESDNELISINAFFIKGSGRVDDIALVSAMDTVLTPPLPEQFAPVITSTSTLSVNENQTTVFTATATDANGGSITYSISGGDSADFAISSGVITFNVAPDYETKKYYTFDVTATDDTARSATQSVTININNLAETIPTLTNFTGSAYENTTIGTVVGTITVTDSGDTNITGFTLSDTTNFEIDSNGVISTKTTFDYEITTAYSFTAYATNEAGNSAIVNVNINVNNITDTVPSLTAFTTSVNENADIGTSVGVISIMGIGDSDITSFTLSDTTNFEVNASGYIKTKTALDYETTTSYALTAYATNLAGSSASVDVSISISNINETPSVNTIFSDINILENSATSNYDINISDEDGDDLTLSIDSNDTSILSVIQNYSNSLNQASYENQILDFNLTTVLDAFGEVRITITVDDGELNTTTSFDVNVTALAIVHNTTTYYPVKSPYTGKVWLDRNLGADQVCTAFDDSACYGDYYQWGRDADGHQESNSTTTTAIATDINNVGHDNYINVSGDWTNVDSNGSLRMENWSKTDGNSVCPVSYRVPTKEEIIIETITQGVSDNIDAYNNFLKLPSSGYRYLGNLSREGISGRLWINEVENNNGSRFSYTDTIEISNFSESIGYIVRCIKDNKTPTATAQTIYMDENTATSITLSGDDEEGADLIYEVISNPSNGTLTGTAPNLTYTPTANYNGTDSFTFRVNDGVNDSSTVTISITIDEVISHNGTTYKTVTSPYTGKIWLDRNLGADQVCAAYNDSDCYGDYYQWGRNYDGHQESSSTITTTLSNNENSTGHDNFIKGSSDWASVDLAGTQRTANWSKIDGTSVCPIEYRVPTITELEAETLDEVVFNRTDAYNNFLKLPSAGSRHYDFASMNFPGSYVYIWSSSVSGAKSHFLFFNLGGAYTTYNTRASGYSVRCIKD